MPQRFGCLFTLLIIPLHAILYRDEDTGESNVFFWLTFCLIYFLYFVFILLIEDLSVFLVSSVFASCVLYFTVGLDSLVLNILAILIILFTSYKISCMYKKRYFVREKQSFWTSLSHGYQLLHTEIANEVKKVL